MKHTLRKILWIVLVVWVVGVTSGVAVELRAFSRSPSPRPYVLHRHEHPSRPGDITACDGLPPTPVQCPDGLAFQLVEHLYPGRTVDYPLCYYWGTEGEVCEVRSRTAEPHPAGHLVEVRCTIAYLRDPIRGCVAVLGATAMSTF